MLQALTQHVIPDPEADHTYRDFLKTNPPIFHKAEEPLEAEDWIRVMDLKFSLICYGEVQKTQFAVQQLQGPASAWWASFLAMEPAGYQDP
jgi:hypothetical protein